MLTRNVLHSRSIGVTPDNKDTTPPLNTPGTAQGRTRSAKPPRRRAARGQTHGPLLLGYMHGCERKATVTIVAGVCL